MLTDFKHWLSLFLCWLSSLASNKKCLLILESYSILSGWILPECVKKMLPNFNVKCWECHFKHYLKRKMFVYITIILSIKCENYLNVFNSDKK